MMARRHLAVLAVVVALSGCSIDPDAGRLYRMERDMWRADWEFQTQNIRPGSADVVRARALADRYYAIGSGCADLTGTPGDGDARDGLRLNCARSMFTAARIYGAIGDSTRVETIFAEMASNFADIAPVAGEVALARGGLAESQNRIPDAIREYESVVAALEPVPGAPNAAGVVMDLPLRMARLSASTDGEAERAERYHRARTYYERLVRSHPDERIQVESLERLAEIAADEGRLGDAVAQMREVERRLAAMSTPTRPPAEARYAIFTMQAGLGAPDDSIRKTLKDLVEVYPDNRRAVDALFSLASNADAEGRVDEALGYLDRVVKDYGGDDRLAARALMETGRLLERTGRWGDALTAYRRLSAEHPLTPEALRAPLEIYLHYERENDKESAESAIARAERTYRDFIDRYPRGRETMLARLYLAESLKLQKKSEEALQQMLSVSEDLKGAQDGVAAFLAAADVAYADLADTARAAGILDRAAEVYSGTEYGIWFTGEARRLRGK